MPDLLFETTRAGMTTTDGFRRRLAASLIMCSASAAFASGAGTIDVWVDLSAKVPDPADGASAAERQRDLVAAQQEAVADALKRMGAIELARVRHSGNAIAVRIDPSRLDEVRSIAGVKSVRPARTLHPPEQMP